MAISFPFHRPITTWRKDNSPCEKSTGEGLSIRRPVGGTISTSDLVPPDLMSGERGLAISRLAQSALEPKSKDDLESACKQMTTALNSTLRYCPELKVAFPHIQRFLDRRNQIPNNTASRLMSLYRRCLESLGQLAKCWGYNHPRWLTKHLPLLGYCRVENDHHEVAYQRAELRSNVLTDICLRATLVGNFEALKTTWHFLPSNAVKHVGPLHEETGWAFLRFVHFSDELPAARLFDREKWLTNEFDRFAFCFGEKAAQALGRVSPAYNCFAPPTPIDSATQRRLFSTWVTVNVKTSLDVVKDELIKSTRHLLAMSSFGIDARSSQSAATPLTTVPDRLLRYFPMHLINWRLIHAPLTSKVPISQLHQELLVTSSAKEDPAGSTQLPSPLHALAKLLFGLEDMAQEVEGLCAQFIDEAEGFLKLRGSLQSALKAISIHCITVSHTTAAAKLNQLRGGLLACASIALLYKVQLHFGCLIQAPLSEIFESIYEIKEVFKALGGKDLKWEQCFIIKNSTIMLSVVFNSTLSWRGQIFMLERRFEQSGLIDAPKTVAKQLRKSKGAKDLAAQSAPALNTIMYFCRGEGAPLGPSETPKVPCT